MSLIRVNVGNSNHFSPFRDFIGDERAKVGW